MAPKMNIEMVDVSKIKSTQEESRLDFDLVKKAMELLSDGWDLSKIPPIKGYFYTDHVEMTDGHHRYAAAVALDYKEVPVVNEAAMRRGDRTSYASMLKKYRKLIAHPLSK
jgi:hypothetical protein